MEDYHYIGYLLYMLLFGAVVSGIGAGVLMAFIEVESLKRVLGAYISRLTLASVLLYAAFTALVTYQILVSNLVM